MAITTEQRATLQTPDVAIGSKYSFAREGVKYTVKGVADKEHEGKVAWQVVTPKDWRSEHESPARLTGGKDKRTFPSLDAAAMAVYHPKVSPSAYTLYTADEDFKMPEPKQPKEKKVKEPKQPKAKAEKATKAKAPAKAKADDNIKLAKDGRYRCVPCQKHYGEPGQYTKDTLPQACPEGHTNASFQETAAADEPETLDMQDGAADDAIESGDDTSGEVAMLDTEDSVSEEDEDLFA